MFFYLISITRYLYSYFIKDEKGCYIIKPNNTKTLNYVSSNILNDIKSGDLFVTELKNKVKKYYIP